MATQAASDAVFVETEKDMEKDRLALLESIKQLSELDGSSNQEAAKVNKAESSAPGADTTQPSTNEAQAQEGEGEQTQGTSEGEASNTDTQLTEQSTKEAKEAARRDTSWKALNAEKERLKAEQEAFASSKAELEALRVERLTSKANAEAAQYDRIAAEFDDEDKVEAAKLAREKANEIRNSAQEQQRQVAQQRFAEEWKANYERALEANPELGDQGSDLYKGVEELLRKEKILQGTPDGIIKAVDYVKAKSASSRVSALQAKLDAKTKQIEELNKKLSVGGSRSGSSPGGKSFEDMSLKEQRNELRAMAQQAERESQWG